MGAPTRKVERALIDERINAKDEDLAIEIDCGVLETGMQTFLP